MYVCIYRRPVLSFGRSKWELDFNTPLKILVFSACSQATFPRSKDRQESDT